MNSKKIALVLMLSILPCALHPSWYSQYQSPLLTKAAHVSAAAYKAATNHRFLTATTLSAAVCTALLAISKKTRQIFSGPLKSVVAPKILDYAITHNNNSWGQLKNAMSKAAVWLCPDCTSREGKSHLHMVAEKGDINLLNKLIEAGANIEVKDSTSKTPLHWAAWFNKPDIVQTLTQAGALIEAQDKDQKTPLLLAAETDSSAAVNELIRVGAHIEVKNRDLMTPLHVAAEKDHVSSLRELIKAKANIDEQCYDHYTPLHLAAREGHINATNELIKAQAKIDAPAMLDLTPLMLAVANNKTQTVLALLQAGANINAKHSCLDITDISPLHDAIYKNYLPMIKTLLENGALVNAQDNKLNTPLHVAISQEAANLLLKCGADSSIKNNSGKMAQYINSI